MIMEQSIVLFDGGAGTTLQDELGCELGSARLWASELLLTGPATLATLHRAWEAAGSQVVSTVSYQATTHAFQAHPKLKGEQPLQLLRSAITVARDAVEKAETRIALSLGPYGATCQPGLEYSGAYPAPYDREDSLARFHLDRLRDYARDDASWNQVDVVLFETIPNLVEVRAIRRAWKELGEEIHSATTKEWVISLVFTGSTTTTPVQFPTGECYTDVFRGAILDQKDGGQYATPTGIGINCTKVEHLERILDAWTSCALGEMTKHIPKALWLYPDGGPTYDPVNRTWTGSSTTHQEWAHNLVAIARRFQDPWSHLVLGGCCKAGTNHIRALRDLLSEPSS
ncbi:hypothetical protein PCANC_09300 [Puccinia coronata f. sp. avenae]|nr:hypothetical protein PCANC_09300 [Puccinia coronata f. sp. avenae]